jgi:hypothetical protein
MSDIWKFVQRAAHHVQPKSPKAQAASDEMERDHHEAVGLGRYTLRELAERAAVAAAEKEAERGDL